MKRVAASLNQGVLDHVVALAGKKHKLIWKAGKDVGAQTKSAHLVCRDWQTAVSDNFPDRFRAEHPVADGMKEKIDLVDLVDGVAYELKVSENNTRFEIYRDIFKVVVHNASGKTPKLGKLVFITPRKGAKTLQTGFVGAVRAWVMSQQAVEVDIREI